MYRDSWIEANPARVARDTPDRLAERVKLAHQSTAYVTGSAGNKRADHAELPAYASAPARALCRFADRIVAIDTRIAEEWRRLNASAPRNTVDRLIAASALIHDLTVLTRNTADFQGCEVPLLNRDRLSRHRSRPGLLCKPKDRGSRRCVRGARDVAAALGRSHRAAQLAKRRVADDDEDIDVAIRTEVHLRNANDGQARSACRRSATRSAGSSTPQLSLTRSAGTAASEPSTDW